jgi:hypothetical protein
VSAALQLADVLARTDQARSDGLAEGVLSIAPDSDTAYARLIHNARARNDAMAVRRLTASYEQAAKQFGFPPIRYLDERRG